MTDVSIATNIDVALSLAAAGLFVFPCHSGGEKVKQPMPFIKWRAASTADERQIRTWWGKWPDAAVGLDLAKCGLVVIDCDRHDPAADGVEAYSDLVAAHNQDPDAAPIVATPSYGNHIYFRQPAGRTYGNARGSLPAGIDVRGHGGYVIAPGTVMQDGRLYELWGNIAEAPELPSWLSTILDDDKVAKAAAPLQVDRTQHSDARIRAYCEAAIDAELAKVRTAPKGARNNTLNEAAFALGQLVGAGWVPEAEMGAMLMNAAADCGLGEVESRKTVQSGLRAGVREPREMPASQFEAFDHAEAAAAARRLIQHHDGTVADAETGEIVEEPIQEAAPHIPFPGGLVGDIARWISDTARRPQPELAIGAALAIVGTAAGRQFSGPTKSGTHLYVLGLAPTGKGKDHPLQQISRIMGAAGMAAHIGPSEFISMPAVVNFLTRKPLAICPMDEFGGFMKRINSKRASGFESSISKVLRTMWSTSFAPYLTPEWASKPSEMIHAPCMSIFGASTPEQFYSSMEGAHLEDGTLNRFLLLSGRQQVSECEPVQDGSEVPEEIVDRMRRIYFRSGEMAATWRNDSVVDPARDNFIRVLSWCPDGAQKAYAAFGQEVEKIMDREKEAGAFYARSVEMALRIATIVAVGRLDDDQVRRADIEFGIAVARQSARFMALGAADYMADNDNQANAQRILRAIKARGGRCSYRDLLRSLQSSIRARDMRELLAAMCEAGKLERQEVKPQKGPPMTWYQIEKSPP